MGHAGTCTTWHETFECGTAQHKYGLRRVRHESGFGMTRHRCRWAQTRSTYDTILIFELLLNKLTHYVISNRISAT